MVSIQLPLDEDGFLRRECPSCEQEFKWHHGPTGGEPDDATRPAVYYCPLCGRPSGIDNWWTQEQLEYVQGVALGHVVNELRDELRRMERRSKGLLKFMSSSDEPEHPDALHEGDDMVIVASPCHDWEPAKVPAQWSAPLHCMICGTGYSLG